MSGRRTICCLFIFFITVCFGQQNGFVQQQTIFPPSNQPIPFPSCLSSPTARSLLTPQSFQDLFRIKFQEEERRVQSVAKMRTTLNENDITDAAEVMLRPDDRNGPFLARIATKVAEEVLRRLNCGTSSSMAERLNTFLKTIRLPPSLCPFNPALSCEGQTFYRTMSGVCNNLQNPYQGSASTAFGRLLLPVYDDGLSRPRMRSVTGSLLPGCREVSLNIGSKMIVDVAINHHWVIYGQFVVHDITNSVPLVDSGRKPRSGCPCDTTNTDLCNIIPIPPNDPFLASQGCINTTTTAQAFPNTDCRLSVKEQINGNSHFIDLSTTYGSVKFIAGDIRTGLNGLMKVVQTSWSKFEFPPGQVRGQTCMDGAPEHRCFAAGDDRVMENIVLAGIQAQWLRAHNRFSVQLAKIRPDWKGNDEILYQEARKILVGVHQFYVYDFWLPILIGEEAKKRYTGDQDVFSKYEPQTPGIVFNDVVTGVLRLHTFVRDTVTRCRANGQFIDEHPLSNVLAKCRLAYDAKNGGLDAFLCGSLHDYSYAGDGNYGEHLHHRLFEHSNGRGKLERQDILSLNLCRAREHGIPGYNAYRAFCGLPRAQKFEEFADTMSADAIEKLKALYVHPDDVDLLIGANHENVVPGAVIGPVSVCLIGLQFRHLKYGDRLFYSHEGQFTREQLAAIRQYTPNCFFCHFTDIERVAQNPFRPSGDVNNPKRSCDECPLFDFNPWRKA